MDKKQDFFTDNYKFSIVELEVFNKYTKSNEIDNNFVYYLLVDQDNFIHDYKILVKKLSIKPKTTKAHQHTKKDNLALIKRMQMIDLVELKHEFGDGKKEINKIINQELINRLNKWLISDNWREITFQNIEYIITGSNPSGQGNGKGTFYTLFNDVEYPFGFILQCLNISKEINSYYKEINYDEIWNKKDILEQIDFASWLKKTKLDKWLVKFKLDSYNEKWKKHKEELEQKMKMERKEFNLIEKKIIKLRLEQKKNIELIHNKDKTFSSLKNILYKECFNLINNQVPTQFIYAHIKPVWLIKQEYKQDHLQAQEKLNEIADPNNFIPLPPTVHNLYDHYFFYWDIDGKLIKLKNNLNDSEINNFIQLDKQKVLSSKFYLDQYYNKVIKNKNF